MTKAFHFGHNQPMFDMSSHLKREERENGNSKRKKEKTQCVTKSHFLIMWQC